MWYYESLANHRPCNAWADDSHRFAAVRVIWYNNCVVPLCFEDLMRKKTRDYTPNDLMAALGLALEVGSTQTLLFLVGLRRYTLPNLPPPHLTSTPTPPQIGNTFEDAMANALIACTCRFLRRVDPTLHMCSDHSNIAVPRWVAEIHPPASTTPTHSSICPH